MPMCCDYVTPLAPAGTGKTIARWRALEIGLKSKLNIQNRSRKRPFFIGKIMTPLELVALMQQKQIMLPDAFYSLDIAQRQYAFTVSKLASVEQMQQVLNALQKSVAGGGTFADFKKQVAKDGMVLSEAYLDNVFRTNVQNAYARGRWLEQQANKEARPYLQYRAINDSRVRPSHLKLDKVVRHIDDVFWLNHTPPLAWRCRCFTRALSLRDAMEAGITPDHALPQVQPDAGWTYKAQLPPEQQIADYAEQQLDKVASQMPVARPAIDEIRRQIKAEGEAAQQTIKLLGLTDATRQSLPDMIDHAVKLDKNLNPSAIALVNEYVNGTGKAIDDYMQVAKNTGIGSRVMDWLKSAFASVARVAKSLKNKLTGKLDVAGYAFVPGEVINITTPTLFREALAGQQVQIINAKGLGIDLSKLGSDGALLPPDVRLEVVKVESGVVTMQPTQKDATQSFRAIGGQLFQV